MPKKKTAPSAQKPSPTPPISTITKRDGRIVPFDIEKITNAIWKGMNAVNQGSVEDAKIIAGQVFAELMRIKRKFTNFVPTVEGVQDIVEAELMRSDFVKAAKHYVLYREERSKIRAKGLRVPPKVRKLAEESKKSFRNPLGEFVYYRSYSRWIDSEGRRETYIETVDRYVSFMRENLGDKLTETEYAEVREGILNQEAMPSMRLFQFAGTAARATNVCAYNCAFTAPEKFQDLAEIMYISMCGTGMGFAVESQNVQKFPQIKPQTGKKLPTHVIPDSKEGWADSIVIGMNAWANGNDIEFDFSKLRPAGARLKTMGGKSSGPDPLRKLLSFTRKVMLERQGKRLRNIDLHDIICDIGDCVVSGGVRRSAMISLSDLDDPELRDAKMGAFYNTEPQRMLANNSAVYIQKPSNTEFMEEWIALMKSGSGERGIFNRGSLAKTLPERRLGLLREKHPEYFDADKKTIVGYIGVNPCGEIILQPKQFCNLSEVVARAEDTVETLVRKVRVAAIIGTYQSSLTYFPYLSKEWSEHCNEERLLGLSITGQWDCPIVRSPEVLERLRQEATKINTEYAKRFGINVSTAITCVKPSGTLSQTVDCSSGMHPRHAPYYIRRIRISATDSLFKMLRDQGVPYHPEVSQDAENATTYVLEFPVASPPGSIYRDDVSAIDQLEYWKIVKIHYTDHNPSITISVGETEWIAVADWVYKNWDIVGGLSFLPRDNHVYQLAPYETIDEKRFTELSERLAHIDYSKIITYEKTDELDVKKELACVGNVCEIAL